VHTGHGVVAKARPQEEERSAGLDS
jgi:hypothetical protein